MSPGIKDLRVVHGWRTVDFVFPSPSSRQAMIRTGNHIPGRAIILDSDYWQDGKLIWLESIIQCELVKHCQPNFSNARAEVAKDRKKSVMLAFFVTIPETLFFLK